MVDTAVNFNETDNNRLAEPASASQILDKINNNSIDSQYKTPLKNRKLDKLADLAANSSHYQSQQQP